MKGKMNINDAVLILADNIIVKIVNSNNFRVQKNVIKNKNFTEHCVQLLPDKFPKEEALYDIEMFNKMLNVAVNKRLDWYHAEGFCVEESNSYKFYTTQEIKQLMDEVF